VCDAVLEARVPKPVYKIGIVARLNVGAAISLEGLCAYLKGTLDELQNLRLEVGGVWPKSRKDSDV
jgi:hypothetical protein